MIAIHEPSQSILLRAEDPFAIRALLPKSKTVQLGDYNVAAQHTLQSTRVLRNLGFVVPAPILSQYNWPGKYTPFNHQRSMAAFLTLHRKAFNLSEMGVGKSAAALWAADWLMSAGIIRKVLILSPLSTLERVWVNDIFDVLMHRTVVKLHGTREQRFSALDQDVDFYVLNHEGVLVSGLAEAISNRDDIDLVIIDEAAMFRNSKTRKYRTLSRVLLRPDMRLWLLTGTPCPNAPTDAWATARLVNPKRVPKYFGAFMRATMMQVSQFKWVPRLDAYTCAYNAMQPAIRFKKSECLDLPAVITEDRQADLSKEQKEAFSAMRTRMAAEAALKTILAVNAADKINKLRQILCGAVKDPESDNYLELQHSLRNKVLFECIEQAAAKVIVIAPFKGIIRRLEIEIAEKYSVALINGDVRPKRRDEIIRQFKSEPDPHVLLCHPKVMAHGLNLTEADMLIFYAPIYSNDEYQQVIERFNRTGQTRKMTIVRIGAHPLEWAIYKLVDTRKVSQDNILKLYNIVTEGKV